MQKDGQRVTDAVLVPIILNTFGAVGEKATEFFYAVAGAEAKRISNEISLLSVFQSAEMILQSHAPSNLSNLISRAQQVALQSASQPAAEPAADQAAQSTQEEGEKDEKGFLRSDLRGEIQGAKVQCLGCSTEGKKVFRTAALWNWNLHVQRVHPKAAAAQPEHSEGAQPAAQPASESERGKEDLASAEISAPAPQSSAPQISKVSRRGKGDRASAKILASANQSSAAQISKVSRRGKGDLASAEIPAPAPQSSAVQISKVSQYGHASIASAQRAQPASDVTHDTGSDNCRVVGKDGASCSKASTDSTQFLHSAPTEQGSFGSRNVSDMPSRNPVSKESQASRQTNLESHLSSPAIAKKSFNASSKFSSKSTDKRK